MLGQTALMLGEYYLQCTAALESGVGNKQHSPCPGTRESEATSHQVLPCAERCALRCTCTLRH